MVIKSHEPAKDRNKQNRENKNRVKKVIDTGKEKGITLETPKTEEQKVSVKVYLVRKSLAIVHREAHKALDDTPTI